MKSKWTVILSISNILLAVAFGYTFYCERRSTNLLKQIKTDNSGISIRAEYQDYWKSLQGAAKV